MDIKKNFWLISQYHFFIQGIQLQNKKQGMKLFSTKRYLLLVKKRPSLERITHDKRMKRIFSGWWFSKTQREKKERKEKRKKNYYSARTAWTQWIYYASDT